MWVAQTQSPSHAEPVSTSDDNAVVTLPPPPLPSLEAIPDIDAAATRTSIEMLERVCTDSTEGPASGADDMGEASNHSIGNDDGTDAMRRLEFRGKSLAAIARDRFEARLQVLNRKLQVCGWFETV